MLEPAREEQGYGWKMDLNPKHLPRNKGQNTRTGVRAGMAYEVRNVFHPGAGVSCVGSSSAQDVLFNSCGATETRISVDKPMHSIPERKVYDSGGLS